MWYMMWQLATFPLITAKGANRWKRGVDAHF